MRGRRTSSARRPAWRLAPSDRAAEDATLSPSPSREGREMALRDVSCKAFGPRSQVATGPSAGSAKTGRRSVPSAGPSPAAPSGQPRALRHQRPRQVRVEGPRRVWVRGPRGPGPGACSFPDAVAGCFSPKATSTEPTVNSPASRPHTKPEAASLRTSDRRSLAPSQLLPLSGWLCSPGESLTWHFTSLPAGPGESSPRVSDGPAPHRTLPAPPPALFCIRSFIPQFFTRKANAGARAWASCETEAAGLGRRLLRSPRSPPAHAPRVQAGASPPGRLGPPPQGTAGSSFGGHHRGRGC